MGLDIGLGVLVLLWAVRGWFKGFLRQAVGLGALVGSVYLASTLRDAARPYARDWLPSIRDEVLDRMLWWGAAVVGLVVLGGLGGWLVRLVKRGRGSSIPLPAEPNRADQGAGFLLGALKGAVVASFVAAGLVRFAPVYLEPLGEGKAAVEEQTKASRALIWAARYRPAEQIWNSTPVQSFVAQVQRNGLWAGDDPEAPPEAAKGTGGEAQARDRSGSSRADVDGLRTASRLPAMEVGRPEMRPGSPSFLEEVDREMRRLGLRPDGRR